MNFAFVEENGCTLPAWCTFFFEIGTILPKLYDPKKKSVVALSLPTRAYATSFIACGLVYEHAKTAIANDAIEDVINNLKIGSGVEYIANDGKKYTGIYDGINNINDERFISIKTKINSKTKCAEWQNLRISDGLKIQAITGTIDITKKQRGAEILSNPNFLSCLLGESVPTIYAMRTKLDLAIVGQINILRHETDTGLIVKNCTTGNSCRGKSSDILRINNFLPNNTPYRTKIYKNTICEDKISVGTDWVLFDGSKAFINRHEHCNKQNWIVVLDRTDQDYLNAVEVLNTAYQTRRLETRSFNFGAIPTGITVQYFQESI